MFKRLRPDSLNDESRPPLMFHGKPIPRSPSFPRPQSTVVVYDFIKSEISFKIWFQRDRKKWIDLASYVENKGFVVSDIDPDYAGRGFKFNITYRCTIENYKSLKDLYGAYSPEEFLEIFDEEITPVLLSQSPAMRP